MVSAFASSLAWQALHGTRINNASISLLVAGVVSLPKMFLLTLVLSVLGFIGMPFALKDLFKRVGIINIFSLAFYFLFSFAEPLIFYLTSSTLSALVMGLLAVNYSLRLSNC